MVGTIVIIFVNTMNIEQKTSVIKKFTRTALLILLVASVYFFTARLGLDLATINGLASPVWPATGIAMFFVLRWGRWMAVGVFLGAFAANYLTNAPMVVLVGVGIGNALEALAGIWLFLRFSAVNKRLGPYKPWKRMWLGRVKRKCPHRVFLNTKQSPGCDPRKTKYSRKYSRVNLTVVEIYCIVFLWTGI
jgi:hypothetical protein